MESIIALLKISGSENNCAEKCSWVDKYSYYLLNKLIILIISNWNLACRM
jgi:hypothetical protein